MEEKKFYKDRYKRKNSVRLCFNDQEFSAVEEISKDKRKPKSTALREFILEKKGKIKKEIKTTKDASIYYELHKIGVNVNQIAKKMNTDIEFFLSGNGEQFAFLFEEILTDIEEIKKRIK